MPTKLRFGKSRGKLLSSRSFGQGTLLLSGRSLVLFHRPLPLCTFLLLFFFVQPLLAHPMGNFSVNHYAKITLGTNGVQVDYVIDLAEIPTYQELQSGNITAAPHQPDTLRFLAARGLELGRDLILTFDGARLPLRLTSSDVIFPPGAGGLPTMKMGFVYRSAYPVGARREHAALHFSDANYPGHSGWKEIIAVDPEGALLRSSVPAHDRSAALTNYPTDLLTSPPQDLEAFLEARLPPLARTSTTASASSPVTARSSLAAASSTAPSRRAARADKTTIQTTLPHAAAPLAAATTTADLHSALSLQANRQKTPRDRFTELITTQHLSLWFLFTAAIIAMSLGGLHALEPGHGKTIVAAYLVGSRGTARHAVLLGLIVTASHTVGVFALGAITLYASRYIVPEQLYPWLGMLSGFTIAGLGCYMLLRRLTGTATDHSHLPGATEGHWFPRFFSTATLTDDAPARHAIEARHVSYTQLFTLGITGGIIPCPAALIVLLSAFALHRVALGFFLIVAFSVGLAAVLIGFGTLMVYARRFMTRLQVDGPLTKRWLPVASSMFITVLGCLIAFHASAAIHLRGQYLTKERLGPALFVVGLGLVLGIKHSTDADTTSSPSPRSLASSAASATPPSLALCGGSGTPSPSSRWARSSSCSGWKSHLASGSPWSSPSP